MKKQLVMLGAGGHAKVCYEIALAMDKWEEIIVLDDNPVNDFFEIKGPINQFSDYKSADFFVAIGSNNVRAKFIEELKEFSIVTLVHPSAIISPTVRIGSGTVIMAGVVINAATTIGLGCIINTSASVDHDNVIGDYVHLSPGVNLGGTVKIGEFTWVGIGSSVINDIEIGNDIRIGAATNVVKSIITQGKYVGNPSRRLS